MSCLLTLIASCWLSAVAFAQEDVSDDDLDALQRKGSVSPPSDVEVMRVKGAAVDAIEAEVPESITQFDAAAIQALGAQNISDLAKVTPNVEIRTSDSTSPTFFIRGVGLSDFNANAAGAIAIFQDDVALALAGLQLGQLFDIEAVQVLRGPQGWGPERNASGGAIKVRSRRPMGELGGDIRVSYGKFNAVDVEGALEFPVLQERLAVRTAFRVSRRDGIATNRCGQDFQGVDLDGDGILELQPHVSMADRAVGESVCGERASNNRISTLPDGLETDINNRNRWDGRVIFRWLPPDSDMDWTLNVHGGRLDELSTLGTSFGTNGNQLNDEGENILGLLGAQTRDGYIDPEMLTLLTEITRNRVDPLTDDQITTIYPVGPGDPFENVGNNATQRIRRLRNELSRDLRAESVARNADPDPFAGAFNRTGQTVRDSWGATLNGEFSIAGMDFKTTTGYDAFDRSRDQDGDFTPEVVFETILNEEAWQFFQGFELAGNARDATMRWSVSSYGLIETLDAKVRNELGALGSVAPAGREYTQTGYAFGLSAGFELDFFEDFTFETGMRYQWETKEFDYFLDRNGITQSRSKEVWQAPTGSISVRYRMTEESNIYWKYSRGFKSGTFNASASLAKGATAAQPETVDSLEVGMGGSFWERRIRLQGSAFYYKYKNYQVFVVESGFDALPQVEVINANDAETYGVEIDANFRPLLDFVPEEIEGLSLGLRFGWLESQFLDFTNTIIQLIANSFNPPDFSPQRTVIDYSGNRLINSPQFTLSMDAQWAFDLGRWGKLTPRWDGAWSDDISFDPNESVGNGSSTRDIFLPKHSIGQQAFWLHNLRLAYETPEGNVELALWWRNILDQRYKTFAFDASAFAGLVVAFVGEPSTFGGEVNFRW